MLEAEAMAQQAVGEVNDLGAADVVIAVGDERKIFGVVLTEINPAAPQQDKQYA